MFGASSLSEIRILFMPEALIYIQYITANPWRRAIPSLGVAVAILRSYHLACPKDCHSR